MFSGIEGVISSVLSFENASPILV